MERIVYSRYILFNHGVDNFRNQVKYPDLILSLSSEMNVDMKWCEDDIYDICMFDKDTIRRFRESDNLKPLIISSKVAEMYFRVFTEKGNSFLENLIKDKKNSPERVIDEIKNHVSKTIFNDLGAEEADEVIKVYKDLSIHTNIKNKNNLLNILPLAIAYKMYGFDIREVALMTECVNSGLSLEDIVLVGVGTSIDQKKIEVTFKLLASGVKVSNLFTWKCNANNFASKGLVVVPDETENLFSVYKFGGKLKLFKEVSAGELSYL